MGVFASSLGVCILSAFFLDEKWVSSPVLWVSAFFLDEKWVSSPVLWVSAFFF